MEWFFGVWSFGLRNDSRPCPATTISEIGYLLISSHDMTEILLKQRNHENNPTQIHKNTRLNEWSFIII